MHFLLTGATGYVGKHILARLLDDGHRVTVIVRARGKRLHHRVIDALKLLTIANTLPQIEVLSGDITEPDCGVAAAALAALGTCDLDGLIHCAGLTRFDAHLADEIHRNNLGGTQQAYALAQKLNIRHFHHVSTAYVVGDSPQVFGAADRDVGQAFNNPYEASKFTAECWLAARAPGVGPGITVYRPSIVIGGHPLGDNQAVSTVYTFIKALHFLRECARRDRQRAAPRLLAHGIRTTGKHCHIPLRISGEQNLHLNLVDMADVVEGVLRGLEDSAAYTIRHLTGVEVSLNALRDGICDGLAVTGPTLVAAPSTDSPPTRVEAHFTRITRAYGAYLHHAPRFAPPSDYQPRAINVGEFTRAFLADLDDAAAGNSSRHVGALALAVAGIARPDDYFRALTDGGVGRHFLSRHNFMDLRVAFDIRGVDACNALLHIANGCAHRIIATEAGDADCSFTLEDRLFMRIVAGTADLRAAFFAGKVGIAGNKETALKFGALLGLYYRDIDSHVIDEVAV